MMEKLMDYLISMLVTIFVTTLPVNSRSGYHLCANIQYHHLSPGLATRYQCQMFQHIMEEIQNDRMQTESVLSQLTSLLFSIDQKLDTMKSGISNDIYQSALRDYPRNAGNVINFQENRDIPLLEDCSDLYQYGVRESGVYPIQIKNGDVVMVYCDMETEGGGWTVIQNRIDGKVNFSRNWDDYRNGFGNPNGEYWLGNTHITKLSTSRNYTLRIDMSDWENGTAYAEYVLFRVAGLDENFRLYIGGYSGTAGDSFKAYHNGMEFSTQDSDNDLWFGHCAEKDAAGWWYRGCGYSSLNGRYYNSKKIPLGPDGMVKRGILWYYWKKDYLYSLKHASMKIRRKQKT